VESTLIAVKILKKEDNKSMESEGIRTVQRALDIIDCFSKERPYLNLTEISQKVGLAASTTSRFLSTLENNDYLEKDPSTLKYKLGKKIYYIGHLAGEAIDLRTIAKPIMEELRNQTTETINLYILRNIHRVCIDQYGGLNNISHTVNLGENYPLWVGAGGKAILAFQDEQFIKTVLAGAANPNPNLLNELKEIKSAYSCYSIDEEVVGSSAVSAPIFNINGMVEAALSIAGPTSRFNHENMERYQNLVKDAAFLISSKMGYLYK
jgi:IclR family transcriptional regulator, KDG regulon repressor